MVCLGHKLDQWQALGPFPGGDGHHTVTSSPVPAVNAVERMKGRTGLSSWVLELCPLV